MVLDESGGSFDDDGQSIDHILLLRVVFEIGVEVHEDIVCELFEEGDQKSRRPLIMQNRDCL